MFANLFCLIFVSKCTRKPLIWKMHKSRKEVIIILVCSELSNKYLSLSKKKRKNQKRKALKSVYIHNCKLLKNMCKKSKNMLSLFLKNLSIRLTNLMNIIQLLTEWIPRLAQLQLKSLKLWDSTKTISLSLESKSFLQNLLKIKVLIL
jgi:hypothetical protein